MDGYVALLNESQQRELQRWPPEEGWPTVADQAENIIEMKGWIQERIAWMGANIGSSSNCLDVPVPALVISKIHYNPLEDAGYSSKELEFIEITNTSNQSVDLTGYYIRELGISYQFAANAVVDANQKMYLSSDPTIFENYYGFAPFGAFTRDLSNRSYNIILSDALGNTIDQVNYMDSDPWPEQADGEGPYLQLVDVNSDNSLASNWIASSQSLSIEDVATQKTQIIVYPNPTNGIVTIEYDFSNTDALEFSIYNSLGQSVGNFQLNSSNLQIYF